MRVLLIVLFLTKLSCSDLYVDVKNKYIARGVEVYHGYFNSHMSKYHMFVGKHSSIETVRLNDKIIYQIPNDPNVKFNLLVEYFYSGSINFLIIYVLRRDQHGESVYKMNYLINNYSFQHVHYSFYEITKLFVRISVDINKNAKNHPFVQVFRSLHETHSEIKYTVAKNFMGIEFDGENHPKYFIGNVFDSSRKCTVGYSIFDDIVSSCDTLTIKESDSYENLYIYENNTVLYFEKRLINRSNYWTHKLDTKALLNVKKRQAFILTKKIVERRIRTSDSNILDLADLVSREFYDIEKFTGKAQLVGYTIYQPKLASSSIDSIIDSNIRRGDVHMALRGERIKRVEVYVTMEYINVFIFSQFTRKKSVDEEYELYERRKTDISYDQMGDDIKAERLSSFEGFFPIYMDLDIAEQSNLIYQNEKLYDQTFDFTYYYINLTSSHEGIMFSQKYKFGSISEIDPYDGGNIPCEKIRKEYRTIRNDLNCQEFLIRNPLEEKPMDPLLYEVYVPVT